MDAKRDDLLLLPGLMCDARIFAPQLSAFAGSTVAEYGDADTLALMAERALANAPTRFALLGHSMGARVALEVVRQAPERVSRLALVSTGVHLPDADEAPKRYALRDLGRAEGMAALVDRWLPPMIARDDAALYAILRSMCIDAGLSRFEAQIAALLARPEVESLLPGLACPVLVATGGEDRWSPPAQHAAMAARIPHARLGIVEGAGHMLPVEAPRELNGLIADWLAMPALPHTPSQGETP
ncbi:alpha/beta fold hydrolase [Sphingomonas baiyangensis]|uniref:Alpha/beta fold hydrolase n=1 Tax=Sphingomonas baiyangensis TaxID=2572576 RepID=A0A4U1KZN2_9SPHN|nr:alpha/beta hydrolase [Sphingomonas baiyangensis]TKD49891.1 alpha/beta fold hydrolase [Sphingomonas baiyangensis]